ncbi:MAG: hypothetical protein JNL11_09630 [Bdellovibrionaceae bacterium]|nr:hypothetical protein [Pseudobdellovibrionaceae bacterium]
MKFEILFSCMKKKALLILIAASVLAFSFAQANVGTTCHAFYSYKSPQSSEVLSQDIQRLLRERPYENHALLVFDFLNDRFSDVSENYLHALSDLQRETAHSRIKTSAQLSETLLGTTSGRIQEIENLIRKNALHSDKAKTVTEALKVCSRNMAECQESLRIGLAESQSVLNDTIRLIHKLQMLETEISQVQINDSLTSAVENMKTQFVMMRGTLNSLKILLEQQISLGSAQAMMFPNLRLQLLDIQMRGVDLGLKIKTDGNTLYKAGTLDKSVEALLKRFPAEPTFNQTMIKLLSFSEKDIQDNLPELLIKFAGDTERLDTPLYNIFWRENYVLSNAGHNQVRWERGSYESRVFNANERKYISGYSLGEVKEILDLAIKSYEKGVLNFTWKAALRGELPFVAINTIERQPREYRNLIVNNTFSGQQHPAIFHLYFSLMSRLRHKLNANDLDVMTDYLLAKVKPILEKTELEYAQKLKEAQAEHSAKLLLIKENYSTQKKKLGVFSLLTRFSQRQRNRMLQEISRRDDRIEQQQKEWQKIQTQLVHSYAIEQLKDFIQNIEAEKQTFFSSLVLGAELENAVYTNGQIFYRLTAPEL